MARAEKAASAAAAAATDASEARVFAAKHLLNRAVKSKVEQAALRQAFAATIREYDEQTSLQVRKRSAYRMAACVREDGLGSRNFSRHDICCSAHEANHF